MIKRNWSLLQLFAGEGSGEGGGEGAASGAEAVDPGRQRLLELGVPADKIRKRAYRAEPPAAAENPQQEQEQTQEQAAAAEDNTQTDGEEAKETPKRMTWEEIMADPEYNEQMQAVVKSRLKKAKASQEAMDKLTPALEVLARQHKLDPANIDYDALAKAISDDNSFYEQKALEMGTDVETAKKFDQKERDDARAKRQEEATLQDKRIQDHIESLHQQGEALKKVFPGFDLRTELQNPAFARMTSPNVGISVEDAYYAVHRQEIQAAAMQATAQQTAKKISNSIQAGQRRPAENGTSGQSSSVTTFDYRTASPQERAALKKRILDEAAMGRKVYPGR